MTAAKKKNSRRKQARFRSSRRKRIRNTVLLLLLLVVLGGTGIGAIYVLRNGTVFDKLEDAYVASREFSGGITDLDSLRADGFAKNLCVVVSDVPMDGVSLGENQKGLPQHFPGNPDSSIRYNIQLSRILFLHAFSDDVPHAYDFPRHMDAWLQYRFFLPVQKILFYLLQKQIFRFRFLRSRLSSY